MGWLTSEVVAGLVGGLTAISGQLFVHWYQQRPQAQLDESRKESLRFMLDPKNMPDSVSDGWRKIETLQRVIGADRETTTRLLVEIGARGSMKNADVWALIRDKPIPTQGDSEDA